MDLGQKFLVIRFGTNIKADCIKEHERIVKSIGECWFGKIGVVPSKKSIDIVLGMDNPKILLYTKNHAYECGLIEVSLEKPKGDYPEYYNEELFDKGIYPNSYYKLSSIKEIGMNELGKYVVVSSRNRLTDTLNKSMSSYFFAEYPDKKQGDVPSNKRTKKIENTDKKTLSANDCRYKKDGCCSLKSCINYKYECERPNMCAKQKR